MFQQNDKEMETAINKVMPKEQFHCSSFTAIFNNEREYSVYYADNRKNIICSITPNVVFFNVFQSMTQNELSRFSDMAKEVMAELKRCKIK